MKLSACFSKLATASLIAAAGLTAAATASADLSDLRGTWVNIDSETRGLTKVVIGGDGAVVSMAAWGACVPNDCAWGEVPATPLANSVSTDPKTADRIVAVYDQSHKMSILNAYRSGRLLVVDNASDFKDNRADTFHSYTFKRLPTLVNPGLIIPLLEAPILETPVVNVPAFEFPVFETPAVSERPTIINPSVLPGRPVLDLSLLLPSTNLDKLEGVWKNVDPNTRGITKLKINVDGASVKAKAWGSCSPTDCAWAWTSAQPLTASVSDPATSANSILAVWDSSIAKRSAIMTRNGSMLTVQISTVYKDNCSDRLNTYVFKQ
jgi:hypothetical protein